MATTKTLALKIDVQGEEQLKQLQYNFDNSRRALQTLNKAEKAGIITAKQANAERARLNVQLKANRNALTDQQNAILRNNDALKKNSGFVAGVKKGVGQWATSMIGVTAAIAIGTRVIGNMVSVVTDFSKSTSTLAAVLGKSKEEIRDLSTQAKQLGATTAFTASQVVELQTEFAKLGFPTGDIKNMTASTLDAAAALGSDLGEQAALTGAVLKGFGLDSTEAARVNDVLAKSASSSALDFSKLSTALPIVGATAKTAGVDLERTTALLGTLSDRGIDASTSATSLRNIFLELSKKGLTFEEAMAKINGAADKNAVAMDLFGKRSATAGIIIAEAGISIDKLEGTLNNAEGAAKAMADTMLDNLAGDITKAESAWEGFILSLEDGEGAFSQVSRSFTQGFTSILGQLTKMNEGDWFGVGMESLRQINPELENFIEVTDRATGETRKLSITQEDLLVASEKNAEIFGALNEAYKNKTISAEKYAAGVKELVGGYDGLTDSERKFRDDIAGLVEDLKRGEISLEQFQESVEKTREQRIALGRKKMAEEVKQRNAERKAAENQALNEKLAADNAAAEEEEKANEKREKAAVASAKRIADAKRKEEEKAFEDKKKREIDAQKQLEQLAIQSIEDDRTREKLALAAKFDDKIAAIKQDSEAEKTLVLAIEEQKRTALNEQDAKFKEEDKAKQQLERALKLENALMQAEEDLAQQNIILEQQRQLQLENDKLTSAERERINLEFNQRIAENTKNLEKEKQKAVVATANIAIGALDAASAFAAEGSDSQKALASAAALISTYLAAQQAYQSQMAIFTPDAPIRATVAAGVAVAQGLARVKAINAVKAAKGMYLEDGGMINGASHANGGVPFTVDGRTGFEAEGGEAIINKRSTALFKPLLSQINQAGGGVAFAKGGLVSKFQNGGLSPSNVGVTSAQQGFNQGIIDIDGLSQSISNNINSIEVVNVATNTSQVATEVINIQNEATF